MGTKQFNNYKDLLTFTRASGGHALRPVSYGTELVTNGTFDTDVSGWNGGGGDYSSTVFDSGTIKVFGNSFEYQGITTEVGKVYAASVEITATSQASSLLRVGTAINGTDNFASSGLAVGSYTFYFVATATTTYVTLKTNYSVGDLAKSTNFDNISVREINPMSVSIGMEGRMTYADEDSLNVFFFRWYDDGQNYIQHRLDTRATDTGQVQAIQVASGTADTDSSGATLYSPDVLVPFNIAGRHGSTFVEVAADGNSFAPNTTPTALPDLSSTDLSLAYDYMGTISEFRVWDKDLGDDGIVDATNPSLEPSLSLTFEGIGTNSFVVNNWSE